MGSVNRCRWQSIVLTGTGDGTTVQTYEGICAQGIKCVISGDNGTVNASLNYVG